MEYVYVYVPKEHVQSILTHGYESARAHFIRTGFVPVDKYKDRLLTALTQQNIYGADALQSDPTYMQAATIEERVLAYLDWHIADTYSAGVGSRAVYVMYHPIPTGPLFHRICKDRWPDLSARVLLVMQIDPRTTTLHPIGNHQPSITQRHDPNFWASTWKNALQTKSRTCLNNIPHAMILTAAGCIDKRCIAVVQTPPPYFKCTLL